MHVVTAILHLVSMASYLFRAASRRLRERRLARQFDNELQARNLAKVEAAIAARRASDRGNRDPSRLHEDDGHRRD